MSAESRPRILVVDDEPSVLETIGAILAQEGYEVSLAASVEAALAHLHRCPYDVVLTDLRLDGAEGISLLATIRRDWPDTVTLVLTGYASLDSAVTGSTAE